jgi:hypothetical protein
MLRPRITHFSSSHFYLRNKEMGLVNSKSEAGLCPNYGYDRSLDASGGMR